MFVPVVDKDQQPLMPTSPRRAAKMIRLGKATPFWKRGIFCVRLNIDMPNRQIQKISVGIDPGSKREGFSVRSAAHTYLNIQAVAVGWVGLSMKARRMMRKRRRMRKSPCRSPRFNRCHGGLPPSTRARWLWKLRILNWLSKLYPIAVVVVEDIRARPKKKAKKWNMAFSPLEAGKNWFYSHVKKHYSLVLYSGYETHLFRSMLGLSKTKDKVSETFEAHCVDSWALSYQESGGSATVDNKKLLILTPLRFHRRRLHCLQPAKGGNRRVYGGTRSLGFTRGSYVLHRPSKMVVYIGGTSRNRISLYDISTGKRLTQLARVEDCKFKTYSSWRFSHNTHA